MVILQGVVRYTGSIRVQQGIFTGTGLDTRVSSLMHNIRSFKHLNICFQKTKDYEVAETYASRTFHIAARCLSTEA